MSRPSVNKLALPEDKAAAVMLWNQGEPLSALSRHYGVSETTIRRWAKEMGSGPPVPRRRRSKRVREREEREKRGKPLNCNSCDIRLINPAELCGFCEGERAEYAAAMTLAVA